MDPTATRGSSPTPAPAVNGVLAQVQVTWGTSETLGQTSLRGTLRSRALSAPRTVEIVDLTTGGARIRGVELPVGTQVTLDFTPPYRDEPVSVRAVVAHGTHGGEQPWTGLVFRLVAMRGGR
jgi:hypothetical protein